MSHKIIITDPKKFREALQKDDKLFDSVKRLVEACDADHPLAYETTRLPCVATSRQL
jgi:hypothetical protein